METKVNPWRCRYCMRLVKGKSAQCGGCWRFWGQCHDSTYVHQQHRPSHGDNYTGGWQQASWEEYYPWPKDGNKSPRKRTQSPRQRQNRPKSRKKHQGDQDHVDYHKGKGKGGGAEQFAPSTQWLLPPSLPASMESQALPSTATPPTAMGMTSIPSMQPFAKPNFGKDEAELHSLRHMYKEIKNKPNLPEDIKKVVQATESTVRKVDAKTHSQLVSRLNTMRKKLNEIDEQWEAYRNQWANYLDEASQMWMSHVESFEDGENKFATRRKEALQKLQATRSALHEAHQRTMEQDGGLERHDIENAKEALDASMSVEEPEEAESQLVQIKEDLTGIVRQVRSTIEERIRKRDRSRPREASAEIEEVEVVEPADKKQRDSA